MHSKDVLLENTDYVQFCLHNTTDIYLEIT